MLCASLKAWFLIAEDEECKDICALFSNGAEIWSGPLLKGQCYGHSRYGGPDTRNSHLSSLLRRQELLNGDCGSVFYSDIVLDSGGALGDYEFMLRRDDSFFLVDFAAEV